MVGSSVEPRRPRFRATRPGKGFLTRTRSGNRFTIAGGCRRCGPGTGSVVTIAALRVSRLGYLGRVGEFGECSGEEPSASVE
jgi:hypothetical protein